MHKSMCADWETFFIKAPKWKCEFSILVIFAFTSNTLLHATWRDELQWDINNLNLTTFSNEPIVLDPLMRKRYVVSKDIRIELAIQYALKLILLHWFLLSG